MTAFSSRQWLLVALLATLAFRFWLAAVAPVTSDEAYFILWGRNPALGYYDHPPMIGWLLAPLAAFSEAAWLMRLPAVLVPPLLALGARAALLRWFERDEDTANFAALAILLVPMNVWNVLITTDTPLVLFSAAATLVYARAVARNSNVLFVASGLLLGLAFLSKYFAVLLGVAFLVHAISIRKPKSFGLVFLGVLPAGLVNLKWNLDACWSNVMFNAINRHDDAGFSLLTPPLYAVALAYLAAPLLWFAWRERARLGWKDPVRRSLLLAWLLPLAIFALLSPAKRIGLHWLLSFLPALVLSVALLLEKRPLVLTVRIFGAIAVLQAIAILVAAALPAEAWKDSRIYPRLVFPGRTAELMNAIAPWRSGRVLATDSYASSALLAYRLRHPVPVFGIGTSHARQDDIATDWRQYAGKDLLILRRALPRGAEYTPYFRSLEVRKVALSGGEYYAILGSGFDLEAYRQQVIEPVRARYYRIPAWLPAGRCYFSDRYPPR